MAGPTRRRRGAGRLNGSSKQAAATPDWSAVSGRWGPKRRLEFIDFRLQWDGTINRSTLIEFFGITAQQASSDLARYAQLAPDNLAYDKSARTYRATAGFKPLLAWSDAQHYLSQLTQVTTGDTPTSTLFIGWRPPCDVIRDPTRPIQTQMLLHLLLAIRGGGDLRVQYQSANRSRATARWIAPHALVRDGSRWHVRAWCHKHSVFRDFAISRVLRVLEMRRSAIDAASDANWHTYVDVVVRPRPGLTDGQRAAIEVSFDMEGGRLVLNCRKALVFYLLCQLRLERLQEDEPIAEQPLELENRPELFAIIAAARSQPLTDAVEVVV